MAKSFEEITAYYYEQLKQVEPVRFELPNPNLTDEQAKAVDAIDRAEGRSLGFVWWGSGLLGSVLLEPLFRQDGSIVSGYIFAFFISLLAAVILVAAPYVCILNGPIRAKKIKKALGNAPEKLQVEPQVRAFSRKFEDAFVTLKTYNLPTEERLSIEDARKAFNLMLEAHHYHKIEQVLETEKARKVKHQLQTSTAEMLALVALTQERKALITQAEESKLTVPQLASVANLVAEDNKELRKVLLPIQE